MSDENCTEPQVLVENHQVYLTGSSRRKEREKRSRKNVWKNNGQKFPKFKNNIYIPESQ
jgi:hypothetical protein